MLWDVETSSPIPDLPTKWQQTSESQKEMEGYIKERKHNYKSVEKHETSDRKTLLWCRVYAENSKLKETFGTFCRDKNTELLLSRSSQFRNDVQSTPLLILNNGLNKTSH